MRFALLSLFLFGNLAAKESPKVETYNIVERPAMVIVGIECRTSNANAQQDIPPLWQKFYAENISALVPNKTSNEVVALYCDYAGDHTQPYSLVIGYPVSSTDHLPTGLVAKTIPATSYAAFPVTGEFPQGIVDTWGKVWSTPLSRTYSGDFELYGENGPDSAAVYIAIEKE